MQINKIQRAQMVTNHNGLSVREVSPEKRLRRMVLAHMLFEKQFYVDGQTSVDVIKDLVSKVDPKLVQALAVEARTSFKLRHIPLLLARELARTGKLPANVLTDVIQRPDEMGEFLAHYWSEGKQPISNQVRKGLAGAFHKFNEYSLAKWDKNSAKVRIRDVMFLTHVKPTSPEQEALFKRIADDKMVTPDTWETELSSGADKKITFMRLMGLNKLGALAFLRNLRNMVNAGVPEDVIRNYAINLDVSKVLPFRFLAAARVVPQLEDMLETLMFKALADMPKLKGKTSILVDISGSMFGARISEKSDLDRFDAAAALAVMCRELCEEVEIHTFSTNVVRVPNRRGFALVEALKASQHPGGTDTRRAVETINSGNYNRAIIFTDEQSSTRVSSPVSGASGYVINVAAYEHGLNHGDWLTISGFSESVFSFIQEYEKL